MELFGSGTLQSRSSSLESLQGQRTFSQVQHTSGHAELEGSTLHAMARHRRQLHIIGHPQFAEDGRIQRHLPSRDGLRLSRRETATLVEDIERGIRGPSPAPPSQHPTSPTPPNSED